MEIGIITIMVTLILGVPTLLFAGGMFLLALLTYIEKIYKKK